MKNYRELAKIHARLAGGQNRMTILCITLAVFLVTGVFSMVNFEYIHMTEKLTRDHGNWHILLSDVSAEEAESIRAEADVRAICRYDTYNYNLTDDAFVNGRSACLIGTDPAFFKDMVVGVLSEGHFPADGTEVLLNRNAKNAMGFAVGDEVSFTLPAGERRCTVCGFFEDTSKSLAEDAVIAVFAYDDFAAIAAENGLTREPQYYIQFEKSLHIKGEIAALRTSHGWSDDQIGENAAVLGMMGMSTSNYIVGLYGVAAILVCIVVLAGVLMISGSLSTGIAERTQYFGMLRCIGAGKRQVRCLVRREALHWLRLAVPIGTAAATVVCWGICAFMAYGIGGEWAGMPVGRVSIVGIFCGILIGYITVLLSAAAPARKAASVSPIAAVTGAERELFQGSAWEKNAFSVPVTLGLHHMTAKKKNLILMTGSFALSIILFLAFSVMIDWVGNALTTTKPYSPDVGLYYGDYRAGLSHDLADELRETDGVKTVYGRMYTPCEAEYHGNMGSADIISYDDTQFDWAEDELLGGDLDRVRSERGAVVVVYEKGSSFALGDTFILPDGRVLTVAAMLSDSPFSSNGIPAVICSEETFAEYFGAGEYSVIEMQLEADAGDETVAGIRSLLPDGVTVSDRREAKTETNSTYLAFSVLVYGFLSMVAMIAVFNILNSISLSVAARRRQYGMMRAIGLERRQLLSMVAAESLGYGIAGCAAGCLIGLPMHAQLYRIAITNYWGVVWHIPWAQLLIIVGVVLLSAALAVYAPVKRLYKSTIIETIAG